MVVTTKKEYIYVKKFLEDCPSVKAKVIKAKRKGNLYGALLQDYLGKTHKVTFRFKEKKLHWKCTCGGIKDGFLPCHHVIEAVEFFKRQLNREVENEVSTSESLSKGILRLHRQNSQRGTERFNRRSLVSRGA